jgi:hypothetical protein
VEEEVEVRKDLFAPLTGLAFLVLLIISFVISGEPPSADDEVQEIVDHYTDNKDSIEIGAALTIPAATLLIFFAAYLRRVFDAAERAGSVLALIPLVGATIIATGAGIDGTISFALAEAADDIDPTAVQALQALWDNDWMPIGIGISVFLWGVGLATVRYGGLPAWLGWAALVLAVIAVTPIGFVSFLGSALWILIASVILTLRARSAPREPAPTV